MANRDIFLKHALANAIKFNGKANQGAVIGRSMQEIPNLKDDMKKNAKEIAAVIKEVNAMPLDKQVETLQKIAPELLEKKEKEKKTLPELKNAVQGKVVTRIAPEPSKYNHIGHALVFLIQYKYAKMYDGKCFLRLEDTNPEKSTIEYYNAMREDLAWIGLGWDKEVVVSNEMPRFYQAAEALIQKKHAYVCSCAPDKMKELREKKKPCACRKNTVKKNKEGWDAMLARNYKEGERVVRLKGDMKSDNGVMRDPVIFRLSYATHFIQKDKYCVWPMYDFENAIMDSEVTHVIRSKEFEMRHELQDYIRKLLGLKSPEIREIGRYQITGAETQGRTIRAMIEKKDISGWDDPRLVTIKALRRRGFVPEMFSELAETVGLSKSGGKIDFSVLSTANRKIIDQIAKRYFFIKDKVKIRISGAPKRDIVLDLHPDRHKGGRPFSVGEEFYIEKEDYNKLADNKLYRLMDCMNFRKENGKLVFDSLEHAVYKEKGDRTMHWLPADSNTEISILMGDAKWIKGIAEKNTSQIKEGEVVQFARFGFCRLDNKEKNEFWFTHN